jgi:hypothetical protein
MAKLKSSCLPYNWVVSFPPYYKFKSNAYVDLEELTYLALCFLNCKMSALFKWFILVTDCSYITQKQWRRKRDVIIARYENQIRENTINNIYIEYCYHKTVCNIFILDSSVLHTCDVHFEFKHVNNILTMYRKKTWSESRTMHTGATRSEGIIHATLDNTDQSQWTSYCRRVHERSPN